jgi:tetratricopeptide (TPR) repeat protein
MEKYAFTGILIFSVAVLSFAQDTAGWGTHSLPEDRSEGDSLSYHNYSTEIGRIAGTVATLDGRPQPDVLVQIRDFGTGRILGSIYTNAGGGFSFEMLPYGNYEVVANEQAATVRQEIEVREHVAIVDLRLNTSDSAAASPQSGLVSLTELRAPRRARDAYQKAKQAIAKNRPVEVSKNVQKALQIYPAYAPALTLRGVLSMDNNDVAAAVEDFDRAIHADGGYSVAYGAMAAALNRLNKFDDALRAAERASSLSPNSWQPYFEMARSYIAKGDYERALQQLTHAQEHLTREYPALHLVRANALLGLKNYSDAANELKIFLKLAPKDLSASAAEETLGQINAFMTSGTQESGNNEPR